VPDEDLTVGEVVQIGGSRCHPEVPADLLGQLGMSPTVEEHETLAVLSDDAGHRWLRPQGSAIGFRVPVFPVPAPRHTAGSAPRAVSAGPLPCVPTDARKVPACRPGAVTPPYRIPPRAGRPRPPRPTASRPGAAAPIRRGCAAGRGR